MRRHIQSKTVAVAIVIVLAVLLASCGTTALPTTKPAGTSTAAAVPTKAQAAEPTKIEGTSTSEGPKVGGTYVCATSDEPETFDPILTVNYFHMWWVGATLVTVDPDGKIVPYLAESWKASEDGLVYDFQLKKGVTFHDGTPLTAADFAYTFQRAMDPSVAAGTVTAYLGGLVKAEAVSDLTLRLTLEAPQYSFLFNLTYPVIQPVPRAAYEKLGQAFGRQPIGVGPFVFKEWATGDHITLERNPDFRWGPAFAHQGAAYIQTFVLRVIPEYATRVAGLEAGEIDEVSAGVGNVKPLDLARLKEAGLQTYTSYGIGMLPNVYRNVSKWPFDDLRVRQALNYALNTRAIIEVVCNGYAVPQAGPLSPGTIGYWPGVESLAYEFNLAKAKSLMAQAGYSAGSDGVLQKDGKRLALTLKFTPLDDTFPTLAQVLQTQWQALGVEIKLESVDMAAIMELLTTGDYELALAGFNLPEADLVYMFFHSKLIGAANWTFVNDPEMDRLVELTRSLTDAEERQQAVNDVCVRAVQQAYVLPLYTRQETAVVSSRVKGLKQNLLSGFTYFDAYLQDAK